MAERQDLDSSIYDDSLDLNFHDDVELIVLEVKTAFDYTIPSFLLYKNKTTKKAHRLIKRMVSWGENYTILLQKDSKSHLQLQLQPACLSSVSHTFLWCNYVGVVCLSYLLCPQEICMMVVVVIAVKRAGPELIAVTLGGGWCGSTKAC